MKMNLLKAVVVVLPVGIVGGLAHYYVGWWTMVPCYALAWWVGKAAAPWVYAPPRPGIMVGT